MTKYKLNIHTHTNYSDGENTIEELAKASIELGFMALVVTDHVYWRDHDVSNSLEKFKQQKIDAMTVSQRVNYPIIVGAEFEVDVREEFLVFGENAILDLLQQREEWLLAQKRNKRTPELTIEDIGLIRKKYESAVVLCHPVLIADYKDNEIKIFSNGALDFIDGYEHYNSGMNMFRSEEKKGYISKFNGLTAFSNSDAHKIRRLQEGYNFVEEKITTETELIQYIRNKKPVEMYANDTKVERT